MRDYDEVTPSGGPIPQPMCKHLYRVNEYCPACEEEKRMVKPLTGGSSDYYKVRIATPTSGGGVYIAECNDIIEALDMNYAEGNAFKAVWRRAALRQGGGKPGSTLLYESEKVEFFGKRLVEQAKEK